MNDEEKKSALKAKHLSITFGKIMHDLKFNENEKLTVVMNLLCSYILTNIKDINEFLKWVTTSIPMIIKNDKKKSYGKVSGNSDDIKIELIDE